MWTSRLAIVISEHYNLDMTLLQKHFSSVFPKQMRSSGMSLIEIMIVAVVFGIVIFSVNTMISNVLSTVKMMEQKNEVLDLRRILKVRLDCLKTKVANNNWATCSTIDRISDSRISGRDGSDAEVISQNGTSYGQYLIKLNCTKTNNVKLIISVSRDEKVVDTDLFQRVPLTCQL